jgi:hypothetical protein
MPRSKQELLTANAPTGFGAAEQAEMQRLVEDLDGMLNRLRLGAIREQLDGLLEEAARRQLNLREALAWLCAAEVARKEQRRLSMAIAHFPFVRTLEMRLAQYAKTKLLIIDELGYLQLEPAAGHLFFQLISRRYEQGSVLISSNRSVEEWDEVFGDQVVAAAILDRLLHHSHVVTIRGDSSRLREKRRSGLFRTQAGASSSAGIGGEPPPTPTKEV